MNGHGGAVWRLIRDVALTAFGFFMLAHETLDPHPRTLIVGAGLILLAGPATIRTVVEVWFGGKRL